MTYTIERLGHLGDGVATGPVFADRTLPGEVVTGDLLGDRLSDVRIVTPSADRIAAKCPAYRRCGGCSLHHASDDFVAGWKQDVVTRALSAQGIDVVVSAMHTSPPNSRRRAKLTGQRTKKAAVVGFLGRASDTIQPITGCMILTPEIMGLIPALEGFTAKFGSRKGRLGFWVLSTDTGLDVAVEGLDADRANDLAALAEWAVAHGLARLSVGEDVVCKLTDPTLTFGTVRVSPPPKAFTQATKSGEAALQNAVTRAVGDARNIIDIFAGCGTLSLPLAQAATVHAVEGDAALLASLDHAVRHAQGIKKVTTERRDLFRMPIDHTDLTKYQAAVIDPPRAGAEQQVAELAKSKIPNVAMISCNPVTFARDVKIMLSGGYKLNWVEVVDQFRWSPHIEVTSHFIKA